MTLRDYIIAFRDEHNLSQREFANLTGLSNGYIAMIEAGKNPSTGKPIIPSITSVKKMASGMGMTVQALMELLDNEEIASLDVNDLTEDERELLGIYRGMEVPERGLLLQLARALKK